MNDVATNLDVGASAFERAAHDQNRILTADVADTRKAAWDQHVEALAARRQQIPPHVFIAPSATDDVSNPSIRYGRQMLERAFADAGFVIVNRGNETFDQTTQTFSAEGIRLRGTTYISERTVDLKGREEKIRSPEDTKTISKKVWHTVNAEVADLGQSLVIYAEDATMPNRSARVYTSEENWPVSFRNKLRDALGLS